MRSMLLLACVLAIGFAGGNYVAHNVEWPSVTQGSQARPSSDADPGAEASTQTDSQYPAFEEWTQDSAPNYYQVLGAAQVGEAPQPGEVRYGELDSLGRATGVVVGVTFDLMEEGLSRERGDLSSVYPTGWGHNREVDMAMPDGTIYHGFLFNRSHLLAKSLGGDDELHNLITGTRTQNVGANINGMEGGMAYCEGLARDWLWAHRSGTVTYRAVPIYKDNDPVARCVVVDLLSNDGSLNQRVVVHNAARGFAINYATGEFEATESAEDVAADIRQGLQTREVSVPAEQEADDTQVVPQGSPESENGERMVIVTGSGEAYHHDETCGGLTHAKSMRWVSVSEAEEMGRHPCSICGG